MIASKHKSQLSLESQIKEVIGTRVLRCALFMMLLVIGLTVYDISQSIKDMRSHVNEKIKPLEDFTIGQMILNNPSAVKVKLESFNESSKEFNIEWKPENISEYNNILWKFPYSKWTYDYKLGAIAGYDFGHFKISGSVFSSKEFYYDLLIRIGLLFVFVLSVLVFLFPLAKKIPQKLFVDPTNRFIDLFSNPANNHRENFSAPLPRELEELEIKIKNLLDRENSEMASQVAHDIRSPLAALNEIIKLTTDIPENTRIMIRNATQQINDIANNLLIQYNTVSAVDEKKKSVSPEIISLLLDSVISQKRALYNDLPIKINLNIAQDSYGIFSSINAADFKRAISNLIDNAVEAIEDKGEVNLNLSHSPRWIQIDLIDTGLGMSQDIIDKIMSGVTFSSKKSGHGIGLTSSRKNIQLWGGELKISSKLKQGTSIHVSLPLMEPAYWFLSKLQLEIGSTVVILDDDKSIHDVWVSRITSEIPEANIQLINFCNPNDLLNYDVGLLQSMTVNFLCDYELLGSDLTGIDVIEKLNIAPYATLVTSRYEDDHIRSRCSKLGIKIIPKSYTPHIPIELKAKKFDTSDAEIVFIDDNKTLTDAWNFKANNVNKKLETFNAVSEFMESIEKYNKETTFYIDAELDNGQQGVNVAKILYDKGYRNLYLATGHKKERFGDISFLKDVVGKTPPF